MPLETHKRSRSRQPGAGEKLAPDWIDRRKRDGKDKMDIIPLFD